MTVLPRPLRTLRLAGLFSVLSGITLAFASVPAAQAEPWEPSRFEAYCGKPGSGGNEDPAGRAGTLSFYTRHYGEEVDIADAPGCLTAERAELAQDYASIALEYYRSLGFASPSPYRLGPVVEGQDGTPRVRFFVDRDYDGIATTRSPCSANAAPVDPEWLSAMRFAPRFIGDLPPPRALHIIAHELFHVVQNAQVYVNSPATARCADIPRWLHEGLADAMGMHVTHRRFPGYRPNLSVLGALSFYGLRPYDRAFVWDDRSAQDAQGRAILADYRTASFWEYLADHYYGGSFAYASGYLKQPSFVPGRDDWLDWLDRLLRSKNPGVGKPFYLVFPDFLANYAMWGRERFPNIGETEWLDRAFGGCEAVSLSPQQPTRGLEMDLEMISGRCLRVVVGGLTPGELAQVKIMAHGRDAAELDQLHMATASIGEPWIDSPDLPTTCYALEKTRPGQPACLIKPYTGERSDQPGSWKKLWSPPRQVAAEERLENLYILAHTPVSPHDTEHSAKARPQHVRLSIGLDVSRMTTAETGTAEKTTALANMGSTENIPMKGAGTGEGTMGAIAGKLVKGMVGLDPDAMAAMPFLLDTPDIAAAQGPGLSMVEFDANDLTSEGGLSPTNRLVLQPTEGRIAFGATGRHRANVTLTDEAAVAELENLQSAVIPTQAEALGKKIGQLVNTGIMGGGGPMGQAEIEVVAFDDELLHLRATGTYCQIADADRVAKTCRRPQPFSAELMTPFGWTWDPARWFISRDTPGMALYRQELGDVLFGTVKAAAPAPASPPAAPQPPAPSAAGYQCTCSCDELTRFTNLGPQMASPATAAQAMQDLMAMQACPQLCQQAWLACYK